MVRDILIMILRFAINLVTILIVVRFMYYRISHKDNYLFNYLVLGNSTLIRYRTNKIPIREMAYLFATVGISVINSLLTIHIYFILIANILVISIIYILEIYNKLKNLDPEKEQEIIRELEEKTGLWINKIKIKEIDLDKKQAILRIYY